MREKLAAAQHEIWSHWMKYLFSLTIEVGDGCEEIQGPDASHWKRQMNTPYESLMEAEKESDRHQADKILAVLNENQ